ncbi:H/ACA ribonucleoprotein complex non-core subunit NAF1-like [Pyrus communis]|uniref:H/ACA ribonucleoprotein complex non-core subunit NAF1-like n=1 Tax=Pyrus communis TaxID=23211 RepID=UPI0035C08F9F
MVGLIPQLTLEDLDPASKPKYSKDPPDSVDPRDLSVADSFLDFDSIEDWFKNIDMAETGQFKAEAVDAEYIGGGFEPAGDGSVPIDCGSGCAVKVEGQMLENSGCLIAEGLGKVNLLGGCEESSVLDGGNGMKSEVVSCDTGEMKPVSNENGMGSEMVSGNSGKSGAGNGESESESSESESESSFLSSSSSSSESSNSSDDEEEENRKGKMNVEVQESNEGGEMEEGEIRDADGGEEEDKIFGMDNESEDDDDEDEMVAWADAETFDEGDGDEDDVGDLKGPIRSKNELEVLPPIPPVEVTLQPHHQMQPVGVVLSVLGTQVIVEGVEKHNPLNEGSILWVTESRSPLGLIDEIFGPVIQPYYVVRYNSESEIPSGIQTGILVSFVPEFADHVLNNKDVYRKGYDASGANDEEISDEAEFSDDEKEAEYRRMQKMSKRGMKDQNVGNKKNNRKWGKNKPGPWKNGQPSTQQTPMDAVKQPPNQHHHPFSPGVPSSAAVSQKLVSRTGLVPPFPAPTQVAGINTTSNGGWANGVPFQPQNTSFPNGFPNNSFPSLLQYNPQYPYQMSVPNRMPFYQQAGAVLPGQQLNAFAGLAYSQEMMGQHGFNQTAFGLGLQGQPIPGQQFNAFAEPRVGQLGFNQNTFGMGLQGQPSHPIFNADQGMPSNGLHSEQNHNLPQSVANAGNVDSQQCNQGAPSNHGRRPSHRGGHNFGRPSHRGGRNFGRGRGRQQSR